MEIILLILLFGGIVSFEVPGMVQRRETGELWAFSLLLLAGVILSFLVALNVRLPSPNQWIIDLFQQLFRF
ncbi:MAG: hypothetical protein M1553_14340 [Firmicutes bacterium]|nr:hypothetical protein [Bacillota bacterium]